LRDAVERMDMSVDGEDSDEKGLAGAVAHTCSIQ
jgi:hypothetical protein